MSPTEEVIKAKEKVNMRTLVLDQGYQPQRIVCWQRAVLMLFAGKVEVVEVYDEEIRSPSISIKMPSVVRVLRNAKRRKTRVTFSRANVALRDGFCCQYCGLSYPLPRLTYDHVIPRAAGGGTTWENIVMACRPCNEKKSCRTPAQAGMALRKHPTKPAWLPSIAFRVTAEQSIPDTWKPWLTSTLTRREGVSPSPDEARQSA